MYTPGVLERWLINFVWTSRRAMGMSQRGCFWGRGWNATVLTGIWRISTLTYMCLRTGQAGTELWVSAIFICVPLIILSQSKCSVCWFVFIFSPNILSLFEPAWLRKSNVKWHCSCVLLTEIHLLCLKVGVRRRQDMGQSFWGWTKINKGFETHLDWDQGQSNPDIWWSIPR